MRTLFSAFGILLLCWQNPSFAALTFSSVEDDEMRWEEEVEEVVVPDDHLGNDIHQDDMSQFDEDIDGLDSAGPVAKKHVDQYLANTCDKIAAKMSRFSAGKVRRATQYFTPLFRPGKNGKLQRKDRRSCINIEGSCIVGSFLYNWAGRKQPWGKRYSRPDVAFKFGKGSGQSYYNKTNALDPCRTLAADPKYYKTGTVIYIPSMRNKICPQTGKTVDGCFIVGDVGSAIKGPGRFDIFTGECSDYNKQYNICGDASNRSFVAPEGTRFYVVGRHNMLAKELREEVDLFIRFDWRR